MHTRKIRKKMRNKITLMGLMLLTGTLAFGQPKTLSKTVKKYDKYSYDTAAEELENVDRKSTDMKRKLAYSYLRTNDLVNAEKYFAEISTTAEKASDVLSYAEVLKMNKKYSEAQQWMEKYASMNPADTRGKMHQGQSGYENTLMKDKGQFVIKNLSINTAQEDFGTHYYKDKVVFASSRTGVKPVKRTWNWNRLPFLDLYVANASEDNELSGLVPHNTKNNKKYHEGPAAFNKAGDFKMFTRNNYTGTDKQGVRRLKMFETTKKNGSWSSPEGMHWNSDEYSAGHATLTADGNTMYFASDKPGGQGGVDLYKVTRDGSGKWGTPMNMGPKINTEGNEMFPFIHSSGIFTFASNGHLGLGGLDMFYTQLDDSGNPTNVENMGAPINGNLDDFAMIFNEEMSSGYFSSNRTGGKGDDDIYSFTMKPFKTCTVIEGIAKDKAGNILPGAMVSIYDDASNEIGSAAADANGAYEFCVEPDKSYALNGSKDEYFDGMNKASTLGVEGPVKADVILEKDPGLSLYGMVTDAKSKSPLSGVKVTMTERNGAGNFDYMTAGTGDFRNPLSGKKVSDRVTYDIKLEKEGYLTKRVTYAKQLTKPGQYDMHADMDLSLTKLEVGMDIGKAININPIYFDVNKYNIRPDAAAELTKIVAVMNEYPTMEIELGSHTDCRASEEYNRKLSDNRAKSSAAWIKAKIQNGQRIYGKGYGESQLVNHCACGRTDKNNAICSEEEHQMNRRTEFRIVKM